VQIRGNSWESSSHVTIEEVEPVHSTPVVDVEEIIPNPNLVDDGDVEPHLGPINLSQFGEQPTNQMAWIPWIKQHDGMAHMGGSNISVISFLICQNEIMWCTNVDE
jgi:hypothetical protein